MEEIEFMIGGPVDILQNGLKGEVSEIWMTKDTVKYNVRFADSTGRINKTWFGKEELSG